MTSARVRTMPMDFGRRANDRINRLDLHDGPTCLGPSLDRGPVTPAAAKRAASNAALETGFTLPSHRPATSARILLFRKPNIARPTRAASTRHIAAGVGR